MPCASASHSSAGPIARASRNGFVRIGAVLRLGEDVGGEQVGRIVVHADRALEPRGGCGNEAR